MLAETINYNYQRHREFDQNEDKLALPQWTKTRQDPCFSTSGLVTPPQSCPANHYRSWYGGNSNKVPKDREDIKLTVTAQSRDTLRRCQTITTCATTSLFAKMVNYNLLCTSTRVSASLREDPLGHTSSPPAVAAKTSNTIRIFVLVVETEFKTTLNYSCNCETSNHFYFMIITPRGHVIEDDLKKRTRRERQSTCPNGLHTHNIYASSCHIVVPWAVLNTALLSSAPYLAAAQAQSGVHYWKVHLHVHTKQWFLDHRFTDGMKKKINVRKGGALHPHTHTNTHSYRFSMRHENFVSCLYQ